MSTDPPKPSAPIDRLGTAPTDGFDPKSAGDDSEDLRERARDVQERIEDGFHEMEARYDDARAQLRTYNDQAVDFIRENPAICVAGAVGVGYLVGKLASRRWLA